MTRGMSCAPQAALDLFEIWQFIKEHSSLSTADHVESVIREKFVFLASSGVVRNASLAGCPGSLSDLGLSCEFLSSGCDSDQSQSLQRLIVSSASDARDDLIARSFIGARVGTNTATANRRPSGRVTSPISLVASAFPL